MNMQPNIRLSDETYALVYGQYAARICVDMVMLNSEDSFEATLSPDLNMEFDVKGSKGIVLVKRDIPPEMGSWHLPGGMVRKGETIETAAKRITKSETGLDISIVNVIGSMEFLNEDRNVTLDGKAETIYVHSISIVLLVKAEKGELQGNADGKNVAWFIDAPESGHTTHIPFLVKHGLLKSK